jgi:hypothetical protein
LAKQNITHCIGSNHTRQKHHIQKHVFLAGPDIDCPLPQAFAQTSAQIPQFSDHPVRASALTAAKKPTIATAQDRMFRTRIKQASQEEANFAGHYVLMGIGCGTSCMHVLVVDKQTGAVIWLPLTLCCADRVGPDAEPLLFRKDSSMVIAIGGSKETGLGTHYYQLMRGKFKLIHMVKAKPLNLL